MTYTIEHQQPYGTVVRRTEHTSPVGAMRRYLECMKARSQKDSAVFILYDGKEITSSDLRKDVREIK
jgi:hypothetical protein